MATTETTETTETTDDRPRIHQEEVYFVIQRKHLSASQEVSWVDSSANHYGEDAEAIVLEKRDEMRKIFGPDQVRVIRRDVMVTERTIEDPAVVWGTVIIPTDDVKELGGPSGHENCRWRLELPNGRVIGCQKTAAHHRYEYEPMNNHADYDTSTGWDGLGRSWEL